MPIFPCAACDHVISVPDRMGGEEMLCPACGELVRIPRAAAWLGESRPAPVPKPSPFKTGCGLGFGIGAGLLVFGMLVWLICLVFGGCAELLTPR